MNKKLWYKKKFPNVSSKVFNLAWENKPWMIRTMAKVLNNTKACHTGFFQWVVYKMHEVGEDACKHLMRSGFNLIEFFQEHERRKKAKNSMN